MSSGRRWALGRSTASSVRKNRPRNVTRSPSRSRRTISNDSSNLAARRSNGNPKARNSVSFHPAPRPRTSRPPLTSCTAAAARASMPGGRYPVQATSGPSRTREVAAARAASSVQASHGPRSGRPSPRYSRWSPTQPESNPASSAAAAMAAYSGHRTSRSTSGSWTPTLTGRMATQCMDSRVAGDRRTSRAATPPPRTPEEQRLPVDPRDALGLLVELADLVGRHVQEQRGHHEGGPALPPGTPVDAGGQPERSGGERGPQQEEPGGERGDVLLPVEVERLDADHAERVERSQAGDDRDDRAPDQHVSPGRDLVQRLETEPPHVAEHRPKRTPAEGRPGHDPCPSARVFSGLEGGERLGGGGEWAHARASRPPRRYRVHEPGTEGGDGAWELRRASRSPTSRPGPSPVGPPATRSRSPRPRWPGRWPPWRTRWPPPGSSAHTTSGRSRTRCRSRCWWPRCRRGG